MAVEKSGNKKQGFIWAGLTAAAVFGAAFPLWRDGGGLCVCGLRGGGRSVLERDEEKV